MKYKYKIFPLKVSFRYLLSNHLFLKRWNNQSIFKHQRGSDGNDFDVIFKTGCDWVAEVHIYKYP